MSNKLSRLIMNVFPIWNLLLLLVLFFTNWVYLYCQPSYSVLLKTPNMWYALTTILGSSIIYHNLHILFDKNEKTKFTHLFGILIGSGILFWGSYYLLNNLPIEYRHFLASGISMTILASIFHKNYIGKILLAFLQGPYLLYYLFYVCFKENTTNILVIGIPIGLLLLNILNSKSWKIEKKQTGTFFKTLLSKIHRYSYVSTIGLAFIVQSLLIGNNYISSWTLLTLLIVPLAFFSIYLLIRSEIDKDKYLKKLYKNANIILYSYLFWFVIGCLIGK